MKNDVIQNNLNQIDDPCNAFICINSNIVNNRQGSLSGFSVAIKDNIEVAGLTNTLGTLAFKDYIAPKNAKAVDLLLAQGAYVVGKTNMHELAYGITSNNAAFGAVRNVYDSTLFAGGSSGGTAVAVASGLARVGLGSDTGGSNRIPAALNGVFGFRPSNNRYSSEGLVRISHTRDTIGVMARNIDDIIAVDDVLSEKNNNHPSIDLRKIRIGVPYKYFYEDLDSSISLAMQDVISQLENLGVTIVNADILDIEATNNLISSPVVFYETQDLLIDYLQKTNSNLNIADFVSLIKSEDVKQIISNIYQNPIPKALYDDAINIHRPKLQQIFADYFNDYKLDALIYPTTALGAKPIIGSDETVEHNGKQVPTFASFIRNVDPSSNAAIPSLTIPYYNSELSLLPMGIQLDAAKGNDNLLLTIARELVKNMNHIPSFYAT